MGVRRTVAAMTAVILMGMSQPVLASSTSPTPAAPGRVAEVESPSAAGGYHAVIRRTKDGIPHILASSRKDVGFGQGWAYADDRGCDLADQVVKLRSQRSRWFGPGASNENLTSDLGYLSLDFRSRAAAELKKLSPEVRDLVNGYAAGFNAYLKDAKTLSGWCAGAPWVGKITATDLLARERDLAINMSSAPFLGAIVLAQPPMEPAGGTDETSRPRAGAEQGRSAPGRGLVARQVGPVLRPEGRTASLGSNAWAVGNQRSAGGRGLLVGTPHFPWEGENRFWESQLTIPGQMQVYGASLGGLPGVQIGFNRDVAWSHTVSAGQRMTMYSLDLTRSDPTRYLVDGKPRAMTSKTYSVQVRGSDGVLRPVKRTLWRTRYGPVIDLSPFDPELGWTRNKAYTFQDANIDNDGILEQYDDMAVARSVGELRAAHRRHQAMPWLNTIAADKRGSTWYADTSATPNLSRRGVRAWLADPFNVLDGSDSRNSWVREQGARRPGLVPFNRQPQLSRRDYVFNANDSYWLANPAAPLTGYSPLFGATGVPQSARTRQNALMLRTRGPAAISGKDGRISLAEAEDGAMSTRSLLADQLRGPTVRACRARGAKPVVVDGSSVSLGATCDVLDRWDGRFAVESRGAVLWRETVAAIERERPGSVTEAGALFDAPFDPVRPVDTPAGLAADTDSLLTGLAKATLTMRAAGHPLDVPLGRVQRAVKAGVPVPGSAGYLGATNVVEYMPQPGTSREPVTPGGTRYPFGDLTTKGYPVNFGSSFMMAVEFRDRGPVAKGLLTTGQSMDPASPHYADQTRAFARLELRRRAFTEREIRGDPTLVTEVVRQRSRGRS